MAKAKNGTTVSAHAPNLILTVLDQRAKQRKISRSRYASLLLTRWYLEGCPEVTREHEILHDRMLKFNELPVLYKVGAIDVNWVAAEPVSDEELESVKAATMQEHDKDQPA